MYGPRSYHKGSVVAQFFKNILARKDISVFGDGTQTRDFVYVDDICRAILLALSANAGGPSLSAWLRKTHFGQQASRFDARHGAAQADAAD